MASFLLFPQFATGQKTNLKKIEHNDAASMFESVLSNSFAWENGDVLFKSVEIADSSNNAKPGENFSIKVTSTFVRLKFDFETSHFLCVKTADYQQSLFSAEEVMIDQETGRSVVAVMVNKEGAFKRFFPQKVIALKPKEFSIDHLTKAGIPDLRTTGVITFGRPSNLRSLAEKVSKIGGGGIVRSSRSIGNDSQKVTLQFPSPKAGGIRSETSLLFDIQTLMPIKRSIFLLGEGDEKDLHSSERFEWLEEKDVFLPKSVSREVKVATRGNSGEVHLMDVEIDAEMHWFSFNEARPDNTILQSKDILDDENRLLRLTDPVASNAERLIEDIRSKDQNLDK